MYEFQFKSPVTNKLNQRRLYLWWPEVKPEVDVSASGGGDLDFLLFVKRLTILRRSLSFFSFCKIRNDPLQYNTIPSLQEFLSLF